MPLRSSHLGINVLPSTKCEPLLKPMFWTQEAIFAGRAAVAWGFRDDYQAVGRWRLLRRGLLAAACRSALRDC